jgi:hypothetical protein
MWTPEKLLAEQEAMRRRVQDRKDRRKKLKVLRAAGRKRKHQKYTLHNAGWFKAKPKVTYAAAPEQQESL